MQIERRMKIAGIIAAVAAIVFAIPHFWFWFGISFAYPGDFQAMPRDAALWVVGGLSLVAALYAILFTHWAALRKIMPEAILALPAWVGGLGFTFWGFSYFNLQFSLAIHRVQTTPEFATQDASPNAIWGYYWYMLFIIWGLSLGFAAYYSYRLRKGQKQQIEGKGDA